ncbi:MAG: hypothetical protein ACOYB3_00790 [Azonexus sp.]
MFGPGGILDEASTLTYDTLFKRSDPKRIWRAGQVRGPPLEIDAYKDAIFHTFNFKSFPSTTGLRHRGYIKFEKPSHGRPMPSEKIPVVVDCTCPDFRYRWAWANKQRGASRVGSQSLNQAHNRAPRITNPGNKIGLCKHLLAARNYIYGLIQRFDKKDQAVGRNQKGQYQDMAWKLDQLVKYADKRWTDWEANTADGKRRQALQRQVQQARNVAGPMPAAEVPPNIDNELPVPLPANVPPPPAPRRRQPPQAPPPAPLAVPPGQRGRQMPQAQQPPAPGRPQRPGQRPQRGNQNPEESHVVMAAANNRIVETMSKDLLNRTKALVEALEDDTELAAEITNDTFGGGEGGEAPGAEGALPPPPEDELSDLPPEAGMDGMEGGAPEDEALGLLRDIAAGIGRLADEIAPMEAPEGAEMGGEEGGEPEKPPGEDDDDKEGKEGKEDEPGVPPVEDDDDFGETMPVASGA